MGLAIAHLYGELESWVEKSMGNHYSSNSVINREWENGESPIGKRKYI